jgi:hypothetical protein
MTDWPKGWHPANAQEAQEYIDAHPDGSGDPELLEECERRVARPVRSRPGAGGGRTKPSPFAVAPEELAEEKGAD